MNSAGLYVHIPFCEHKCNYCNFTSSVQNAGTQQKYFECLKKEIIETDNRNKRISSIFFGGGTPSCVDSTLIVDTLQTIKNNFDILPSVEITLEANPNSVNAKKLKNYFNAGFNRISFGVQSFCDETLKKLGRLHTVQQAFEAVETAKKVGFQNISIDLILGVDKIDECDFEKDVQKMKMLGVTHISAYILQLEKNTPLFFEVQSGKTKILSDDETVDQYKMVQKVLERNEFYQYEISNFALKSFASKHNQNYWACGEYFGFGVGAHSYLNNARTENTFDLQKYFNNCHEKYNSEILTNEQKIEEFIMLSLRTTKGINLEKLKDLGCDLLKEKKEKINYLLKNNLILIKNNYFFIKKEFFNISNQIILELF